MKYIKFLYDCIKNSFEHILKYNKLFVVSMIIAFNITDSLFNIQPGAPFFWDAFFHLIAIYFVTVTIEFIARTVLKVLGYYPNEK